MGKRKRIVISYLNAFDSSSEDEEIIRILTKPVQIPHSVLHCDGDDDDETEIRILGETILNDVQRADRVKTINYIQNTVHLYDDTDFIMHYRLHKTFANELISRFSASNVYKTLNDVTGKKPLTAEEHILAFLWFVGHKSSYRDVADRFNITLSSLHVVITRVADFLVNMAPEVIRFPTDEEREATVRHFGTAKNEKRFPRTVGAVDGTHIKINRPKHDQESYFTRKKEHAIHVQGIVDHRKKFIDVFVGYPGSVHDARVFRNSDVYPLLSELCPGNYFILGDSAYPLSKKVMVPYRDNGRLTRKQKYFNTALSSCRVKVEHAFGELKQRFRQLYHCELRDLKRIVKVIYACCVLHNIADAEDLKILEPPAEDEKRKETVVEEQELEVVDGRFAEACEMRNILCEDVWNMKS